MNDSRFSSAIWFVQFILLVICSHVKEEVVADPLPNIFCSVLLCNITKSSKEAVADPTWVQSAIATRSNYFVVDNMVYMGTVQQ